MRILCRTCLINAYRTSGFQMSGYATYQELTKRLELRCGASTVKTFWQKLVERYRRNQADLDQIVLELAREEVSKPLLQPFPKRPYKASTIILFCVFGFFVVFAAWVCFKELVIPFFR
jgi:hypothetical protein